MYEIMSDLGKYLVNRYALCLKGSNMPRPPLIIATVDKKNDNNNEGDIIKIAGGRPPFCQIAQSANIW